MGAARGNKQAVAWRYVTPVVHFRPACRFLGSQASPPSSLLFTASGEPLYSNPAGRDWALINGAFQPTIEITAQR